MKCPCCDGTGIIPLSRMQFKVWDALRRAGPDGLSASALAERVYAGEDGGPDTAINCIWGHAYHANKRLAALGQRIVSSGGPGSTYRLVRATAEVRP